MLIKVCGMTDAENIREVEAAGADLIGLIFYQASPRCVPFGLVLPPRPATGSFSAKSSAKFPAYSISEILGNQSIAVKSPGAMRVGVFVNECEEVILQRVGEYSLDYVQLHGSESPELCGRLRAAGLKVIKAFHAAEVGLQKLTAQYLQVCDLFLFDTPCKTYGGSGKGYDWSVLEQYHGPVPFLLSGGLRPESIGAVRTFRHPFCAGVDLNSGFELAPGHKNPIVLAEFIFSLRDPAASAADPTAGAASDSSWTGVQG